MIPRLAFCTIVAKNYLAYARVLAASVTRHHPEAAFYVLLVDDAAGFFDPAREPFPILTLSDLALPHPREMSFRYDVLELSTAVKPWLLSSLFARGHTQLVFLDPDIQVYRPLGPVVEALREAQVVLTPHLLAPTSDAKKPGERDILLSGTYNLGFLGLSQGAETDALLAWWQSRCRELCVVDTAAGLFVDQRWIDLVPGFLDSVRVLREPGCNVAYWNLAQRPLTGPAASPLVGGGPLYFFHFSGFDALRPDALSKHQDRFPAVEGEPLLSLTHAYSAALLAAGHQACLRWPYTHGTLADGHPISRELREVFRDQPLGRYPDPFAVQGKDTFLSHAISAGPDGGPAPLLHRIAAAWRAAGRPSGDGLSLWRRTILQLRGTSTPEAAGLAPLAARILLRRPDVREASLSPSGVVDRVRFLHWLAGDGVTQHQLKPAWCLSWLQETQTQGAVARVLDLYDANADLQRLFPMAFVEEHDTPAFVAYLMEHATDLGLDNATAARARAVAAENPVRRIAEILQARVDVRQAFPDALAWPGNPAFPSWLRQSGRQEYGLSEDSVLWFGRARAQHVCVRLQRMYESRSDWRERFPHAFSPFGRAAFLAWLQTSPEATPGFDVSGLRTLCPVENERPLDALRALHQRDGDLRARFPRAFHRPADTEGLLEWVESEAAPRFSLDAEWLHALRTEARAGGLVGEGARIVGYLRTESGMGELARSTARALAAVDYPLATLTLEDAPQRQADLTVRHENGGRAMPFTIVHANAPECWKLRQRIQRDQGSYLIGYWAWELDELPPEWGQAFPLFDELWTCSRFAAGAIGAAAPVPVQVAWPAVADLVPAPGARAALGVAPDEFMFLFLYDVLSETERKNPGGLIQAFRAAFRGDDRVRLVIKTSNAEMRRDEFCRVVDAARGLNVTVVDRYLGRADVLGLIQSCDAYVSLHRSEGFGFTLAEAMWLGKPAVATFYSGNTDFMTPWNSYAVPFRMAEIPSARGPYRVGAQWADPDLDAAAAALRLVFTDRDAAAEIARRGQADVRSLLSPRACGERMVRRLQAIAGGESAAPDTQALPVRRASGS
jgi:glycosyltransferase involved in cell wall biosynthesis